MAFLYQRSGSPFWWIRFRDPRSAKIIRRSTGLRIANPRETRLAKAEASTRTAEEFASVGGRSKSEGAWASWVPRYLALRYSAPDSARSLLRYQIAWRQIEEFLLSRKAPTPHHLTRELVMSYVESRGQNSAGLRPVKRRTVAVEVTLLSMLMDEAVRRGLATTNPCSRLRISIPKSPEKPEIPEFMLADILAAIRSTQGSCRKFLERSFLIARYQGCRLSETRLAFANQVDLQSVQPVIYFRIKGGRTHVAPVHPALVPLLHAWAAEGEPFTFTYPDHPHVMARVWSRFFEVHGFRARLPGICFHCIRVTVVTRMARANVAEAKCRAFVGHSSAIVHRVYQRLKAHDLQACFGPIAGGSENPGSSGSTASPSGC